MVLSQQSISLTTITEINSRNQLQGIILQQININMSTSKLKKTYYNHEYQMSNLQTILKARTDSHTPLSRRQRRILSNSRCDPSSEFEHQPLTKYQRLGRTNERYEHHSYSQKTIRPKSTYITGTDHDRNTTTLYHQLSGKLQTINQAIKSLSRKSKKKLPKLRPKVVTEMSIGQDKTKIYQQILKKIQDIKAEKRRSQDKVPQEKTLFYGSDYISGSLFKIKMKLSGSHFRLYCKNNHAKGLLEMNRDEYMQIHSRILQGNPCNILKYVTIEDRNLKLRYKPIPTIPTGISSVKSYFNYY